MTNEKTAHVTVNCKLLNVRFAPDISSAVVRQESERAVLEKLGTVKGGEWTKVPGGYVMSQFVS